jgi:hypothetical protein
LLHSSKHSHDFCVVYVYDFQLQWQEKQLCALNCC